MTEPTIAELDQQIAELQRQRDLASLAKLQAVQALLSAEPTVQLAADLEALLPELPADPALGSARNQAANVVSVIRQVAAHFDREVARIEALVEPEPTEE